MSSHRPRTSHSTNPAKSRTASIATIYLPDRGSIPVLSRVPPRAGRAARRGKQASPLGLPPATALRIGDAVLALKEPDRVLLDHEGRRPLIARAVARRELQDVREAIVSIGRLHLGNVVDGGERGAVDVADLAHQEAAADDRSAVDGRRPRDLALVRDALSVAADGFLADGRLGVAHVTSSS